MCQVSGLRCQVSSVARETDKQGNRTEEKNPHGGLEAEPVGEEADEEGKEFC